MKSAVAMDGMVLYTLVVNVLCVYALQYPVRNETTKILHGT